MLGVSVSAQIPHQQQILESQKQKERRVFSRDLTFFRDRKDSLSEIRLEAERVR